MSTVSNGPAARPTRSARGASARLLEEATRRARLTVVPHRRPRAPRVPFVTLVSLILVGGVVGLLCFNTEMQQASFTSSTLEARAASLSDRVQTLEMENQQRQNPNRVAAAAQRAGMVLPDSAKQLSLATGAVTGVGAPATADNTPRLEGRSPVKPAELAPAPTTTYVEAPAAPVSAADQAALADAQAAAALAAATTAATTAGATAATTAGAKPQAQARKNKQNPAGRR